MTADQQTVVFDDEHDVAEMIAEIAIQLGHRAVPVTERRGFLGALGPSTRMIVLDLSMPDFDGFEAIEHLVQAGYDGGLILISGDARGYLEIAEKLAAGRGLDVVTTLEKPFTVSAMRDALSLRAAGE